MPTNDRWKVGDNRFVSASPQLKLPHPYSRHCLNKGHSGFRPYRAVSVPCYEKLIADAQAQKS